MAVDGILKSLPGCVAAADLSGALYRFVKLDSAAVADGYGVELCDGVDDPILGVAYTNPAAGQDVRVVVSGVVKVVAGANLAVGARVGTNAAGAAVVTATAAAQIGTVLKAAASGALAEVFIR